MMARILFFRLLAVILLTSSTASAHAAWLAPGEPLTEAHLLALLEPALPPGEAFQISVDQPALPIRNPAQVEAALRLLELRYDAARERFTGNLLVRLTTGEERVLRLAGYAKTLVEVLVPARHIAAGEQLHPELLEPLILVERQLRADTLIDPASLIGVEARRRLMAGRPIRQGDVRSPRLVRRGDAVELVYEAPGLALVATARALEDGGQGSLVTVANLDSGQRIAGIVSGPGRVTVSRRSGHTR